MISMEGNEMAKKLLINCASCDARKLQEENYSAYESITVNAATVLASEASKAVMNRLPFALNCANVIEVEGDVDLRTVNGKAEIKSDDAVPERKFYMLVNGVLNIGPDTQKQLAQCVGMTVNGSLLCPESLYATLGNVKVNGASACYPDGAIVLRRNAVIDKLFAMRAKRALYWAARRLIMVDPELDAEALRAKGAAFSAAEVIVAQSKVEALLDLIDEKADIVIVPDGTAVVLDALTLDENALRRYGRRLYVIGDVTVPEDGGVLGEIEYLNVRGDARVFPAQREKLLEVLTDITGEVKLERPHGATIGDKPVVKVTKWMLERQPSGIEVRDCAVVKIAADIPKELLTERLHIEDCGVVECSEEQEDAVALVCEGVGQIGGDDSDPTGDILSGLKGMADTKVINASDYVLCASPTPGGRGIMSGSEQTRGDEVEDPYNRRQRQR